MDCIDEAWYWATTQAQRQNASSIHCFSITHGPDLGLGLTETASGHLAQLAYDPTGPETFFWFGQTVFASDPWHPCQIFIDNAGTVVTQYTGGDWKGGPWLFEPDQCDKTAGRLNLYGHEWPNFVGEAPYGGWFYTIVSLWSVPIWEIDAGKKLLNTLKGPRPQRKKADHH
jgi:hypothetical protein